MKYLNYDYEERELKTVENLREYLDFRSKNDIWLFPDTNECSCIGVNPLSYRDTVNIPEGITAEMYSEAYHSNRLLLVFPHNFKAKVLPVRYTAFSDICNRAGLKGRTVEMMVDKGNVSALDPCIKAQWFSTGMSLNGNECKILIRDEKVSSMKSHEYQIFPEKNIIELLENELKRTWPDFSYAGGKVSHEYLWVDYRLNDTVMEETFRLKLEALLDADSIQTLKAGISLATSDVGNSSVAIAPYYELNETKIRLGDPIHIRHDTCNSFDKIAEEMSYMAALFRCAEERIELLENVSIIHPQKCFVNIINEYKLPKGSASLMANSIAKTPCTAFDIFIKLNELAEKHYDNSSMSLTSFINLGESISKLLYIDFEKFDKEEMQ